MVTRSLVRFPLMALAMVALLAGMWAGLLRLGWVLPTPQPMLLLVHGPLMVAGFLGTLIGVERAVALGGRWPYIGPLFTAVGAVAFIAGIPPPVGPALITGGSVGLVVVFAVIIRQQPALFMLTMGIGAVAWLVGNSLWLAGWPLMDVVGWWVGFLVLTIAGERLELSRMLQLSSNRRAAFVISAAVFLVGLSVGGVATATGARVTGLGLLAMAVWLLLSDIARRTVRQTGLTRFTAVCLLSGYVWLGVAGVLALVYGGMVPGVRYDAVLHAVFLGFVFAMIFGHAPIIFPAVLGFAMPFRSAFYAHVGLLHASLAIRIAGDFWHSPAVQRWGGLLNGVAVLLFLANTAVSVWMGRGASRARVEGAATLAHSQRAAVISCGDAYE